jgi:hypothetical protein
MRTERLNHLGGPMDGLKNWWYTRTGYCSIPLTITGTKVFESVVVR